MSATDEIRNRIIDQLLAIKDKDFLEALSQMIDRSRVQSSAVVLSEDQKLMLAMSDSDIAEGRIIDQHVLHEQELKWLKKK